jgi:hypothetical protein
MRCEQNRAAATCAQMGLNRVKWYRAELNAANHDLVQDRFLALFNGAGAPRRMGLFAPRRAARPIVYFTPKTIQHAASFLELVDARPCERPTEELVFQAGHESTRDRYATGTL